MLKFNEQLRWEMYSIIVSACIIILLRPTKSNQRNLTTIIILYCNMIYDYVLHHACIRKQYNISLYQQYIVLVKQSCIEIKYKHAV